MGGMLSNALSMSKKAENGKQTIQSSARGSTSSVGVLVVVEM